MIIANPIYDSVFKVMMEDLEIAKGVITVLIGMRIVELRLSHQEYVHKQSGSGDLAGIRLDFHAVIETEKNGRFTVTIELQKVKLGTNALRFRKYLAQQYGTGCEIKDTTTPTSLPIISIYLLGYKLDVDLPVATRV